MRANFLPEEEFKLLQNLRHHLHALPELSGQEENTAKTIESFLLPSKPTHIIRNLGGHGLAFLYDSGRPGPRLGFRCELDALPIQENNDWPHRSQQAGVSHKCGHDGHMSIISGLGRWLYHNPPPSGQVMLLFQPAEEDGQGAAAVIADARWESIKPDWLFGLHNIPSYPAGEILLKSGSFCAASQGLLIELKGTTSHAAEPEKGLNPATALASLILALEAIPHTHQPWLRQVFITPVYAHMGERAFGTSAGLASYGVTLRTFTRQDMHKLQEIAEVTVEQTCRKYSIPYSLSYQEVFPATENHDKAVTYVRNAVCEAGLTYRELDTPFRWSEDFGWYSTSCPTAFFGLGSGEQQAPLHHPDYDFPDQIIEPGVLVFSQLIRDMLF